jgi:hypothetical protein
MPTRGEREVRMARALRGGGCEPTAHDVSWICERIVRGRPTFQAYLHAVGLLAATQAVIVQRELTSPQQKVGASQYPAEVGRGLRIVNFEVYDVAVLAEREGHAGTGSRPRGQVEPGSIVRHGGGRKCTGERPSQVSHVVELACGPEGAARRAAARCPFGGWSGLGAPRCRRVSRACLFALWWDGPASHRAFR